MKIIAIIMKYKPCCQPKCESPAVMKNCLRFRLEKHQETFSDRSKSLKNQYLVGKSDDTFTAY